MSKCLNFSKNFFWEYVSIGKFGPPQILNPSGFFSVKSLIKQKSIYLRKNLFYEIKYKHENIDTLNDLKLCRIIASKLKLNL